MQNAAMLQHLQDRELEVPDERDTSASHVAGPSQSTNYRGDHTIVVISWKCVVDEFIR